MILVVGLMLAGLLVAPSFRVASTEVVAAELSGHMHKADEPGCLDSGLCDTVHCQCSSQCLTCAVVFPMATLLAFRSTQEPQEPLSIALLRKGRIVGPAHEPPRRG